MILSTGRKVVEFAQENGSTFVEIESGEELTCAEWEEYCAKVGTLSLAESRARLANRLPCTGFSRMQ